MDSIWNSVDCLRKMSVVHSKASAMMVPARCGFCGKAVLKGILGGVVDSNEQGGCDCEQKSKDLGLWVRELVVVPRGAVHVTKEERA